MMFIMTVRERRSRALLHGAHHSSGEASHGLGLLFVVYMNVCESTSKLLDAYIIRSIASTPILILFSPTSEVDIVVITNNDSRVRQVLGEMLGPDLIKRYIISNEEGG